MLAITSLHCSTLRIRPIEVTSSTRTDLLKNHIIDIECGSTTITEERKRKFAFSRPIFHTSHRIALKKGRSLESTGLIHITGIKESTSHGALLGKIEPKRNLHFIGYSSIGEAFDAFLYDSCIDGIVADEVILAGLLGRLPLDAMVLAEERLGGEYYGFMMRHEDRSLCQAVDRALGDILEAPDFVHHYAPWFDNTLPGLGFSIGLGFSRQLEHLISPIHVNGRGPSHNFFNHS